MTITQRDFPAYVPPPAYPDDAPLSGLCTAELVLVASLRLFALAHCDPEGGHDWRGGLLASGAGCCAVPAFDALFGIVGAAGRRPLDVRCRHCPHLSRDEGRLLQIVSLLQHGRMFDARDVLADWLPPAVVRLAILPAKGLASALARARLLVPLRESPRTSTHHACRQTHHGSALVH
ncbi:MAG: hypothetical protein WDM91_06315 [Rhizomicrobium sp.]